MKLRIASLLLALCLLLAACAGEPETPAPESPVQFYYKTQEISYDSENGVIAPELREAKGHEEDPAWLLGAYFSGPRTEGLVSPFRRGTALVECSLEGESIRVVASGELGDLSGADLTVACVCIARTCFGLFEVNTVRICARDALLDGREQVKLTREDLVLADYSAGNQRRELLLYFADEPRRYLLAERIMLPDGTPEELCRMLLEALLEGPQDDNLSPPLPEGTRLESVSVQGGVCSVNFSREFVEEASGDAISQRTALLSVVNLLTQLDQVDMVEFYNQGAPVSTYGRMDLSSPWVREEEAVGPVRSTVNEFDADLCFALEGQGKLMRIPTKLRQSANESRAEVIAEALFASKGINGFLRVIPEGTRLLSCQVAESGLCTLDVSREILNADNLEMTLRAIVGSMCSLEEVLSVQVLVEGELPETEQSNLFLPRSRKLGWFF